MPGVVSLTAGVEPDFDDAGCDTAGAANVLTSDEPTLPSRGATMSSVRRSRWSAPRPEAGSARPAVHSAHVATYSAQAGLRAYTLALHTWPSRPRA